VAAQLVVGVGEVLAPLRAERVDDLEAVQLQAEGGPPVLDGVGVAEHGEVGDAAQQHLLGRLQHPVVAALGEDDVAAVGLGPLDQPLLEHQRGDPLGAGDLDPAQQPLAVDVLAEHPEGGGDLALALGGEHPPHPGHGGGRPVGVGPGGQHGHLGAAQAVDQPEHRRLGDQPPGQDQPGDVRVGAGEPGGQAADDQVGPVAGGDDHVAVADVVEEVGQVHGPDDHMADLAPGARLLGPAHRPQELGGQRVGDLGHGGRGQLRHLGQDVGRLVAHHLLDPVAQLVDQLRADPVADGGQDGAAAPGERPVGQLHDLQHPGHRPVAAPHHQQHRAAEVVGHIGVEVELEGPRRLAEVAPLDQQEVGGVVEPPVGLQDPLEQLLVLAAVAHRPQVVDHRPERLLVGLGEPVAAPDQLDVVVGLLAPGHDRPEVPDAAQGGQRLHHPEGDRGLAAARLDRGQVDVALHGGQPTPSG
jgi:hypothetical protein